MQTVPKLTALTVSIISLIVNNFKFQITHLCANFHVAHSAVYRRFFEFTKYLLRCDQPITTMTQFEQYEQQLRSVINEQYESSKGKEIAVTSTSIKYRIKVNYYRNGVNINRVEYFANHGTSFKVPVLFDAENFIVHKILIDCIEWDSTRPIEIHTIDHNLNIDIYLQPKLCCVSVLNTNGILIRPGTCNVPIGSVYKYRVESKNEGEYIKSISIGNTKKLMSNTRTKIYEDTTIINSHTTISAEVSKVYVAKMGIPIHGKILLSKNEIFEGESFQGAIISDTYFQIQNASIITPNKIYPLISNGKLQTLPDSIKVQRENDLEKLFFIAKINSDMKIEVDFTYKKLNILVGVYLSLNRTETYLKGTNLQASISQTVNFMFNVDPKIVSIINIQGKKYSDPKEIAKICSGFSFKVKNSSSIYIGVTNPIDFLPDLALGEINFQEFKEKQAVQPAESLQPTEFPCYIKNLVLD
jgi:hypothetical protein